MMNPHFHPYPTELSSPHSPSVDNNNYHHGHPALLSNGHLSAQQTGPQSGGPPQGHPNNVADPQQRGNMNGGELVGPMGPGGFGTGMKVCAGCGGKIMERYLLHALDRYWHHGCLKCSCCGAMLADIGASCFTKGGMILCKTDYIRLFGNSGACSACGQTIPASEFVMRAGHGHVFHLKCFVCSKCGGRLVPGDRYCLLHGALVCEQDSARLGKAATGTGVRKGKVGRPRRSRD